MIHLCKFSGRLSYPLYITHIAFVYVLANYASTHYPSTSVIITGIFILLPIAIVVAWLALKFYDEPVRAWLTLRYGVKR
jgi:peptidoglycan/LPS O-acetylase OafA/YrhL